MVRYQNSSKFGEQLSQIQGFVDSSLIVTIAWEVRKKQSSWTHNRGMQDHRGAPSHFIFTGDD